MFQNYIFRPDYVWVYILSGVSIIRSEPSKSYKPVAARTDCRCLPVTGAENVSCFFSVPMVTRDGRRMDNGYGGMLTNGFELNFIPCVYSIYVCRLCTNLSYMHKKGGAFTYPHSRNDQAPCIQISNAPVCGASGLLSRYTFALKIGRFAVP